MRKAQEKFDQERLMQEKMNQGNAVTRSGVNGIWNKYHKQDLVEE